MPRASQSTTIDAPADEIFNRLTDIAQIHRFYGGSRLKGLKETTGAPLKAGSEFEGSKAKLKVVDYVDNQVFAFEYEYITADMTYTEHGLVSFEIQSVDGHARITMGLEILGAPVLLFFSKIFWPIVSPITKLIIKNGYIESFNGKLRDELLDR
jgi:uncharacterized protein YndB with AHSA1/START domain